MIIYSMERLTCQLKIKGDIVNKNWEKSIIPMKHDANKQLVELCSN